MQLRKRFAYGDKEESQWPGHKGMYFVQRFWVELHAYIQERRKYLDFFQDSNS